jgi:hypothetical protein
MAVTKKTIIATELVKLFRDSDDSFLSVIKSHDEKVGNDVINFNTIGADPDVLINNTVYPIPTMGRTDDSVPVSLFKMETKNTEITDDELYALGYDKKSNVMLQHRDTLKVSSIRLGAHSLAPAANSANTPVIKTTGTLTGGLRALLPADLVTLKGVCDTSEIPVDSRNLVLSSKHVNDLLLTDQAFRDRYYNTESGKVIKNIYGFNIWESIHTPRYSNTFAKKAFGSVVAGNDVNASVFFSIVNAMRAMGSVNVYLREAANDPENRKTVVGMRMWYIVHPVSAKGIASIVDNNI